MKSLTRSFALALSLTVATAWADVATSTPTAVAVSPSTMSTVAVIAKSTGPAVNVSSTNVQAPQITLSTSTPSITLLTLPQSITLALDHATTVLKAKNQKEYSGTALLQAYYQFLPNLEAGASYLWTRGSEYYTQTSPVLVKTTNRAMAGQLTSTLNLFNGLSDLANWKASSQRNESAAWRLYRAKQDIVLDVTQAYLQVLLDGQLVMISQKNLQASQARQDLLTAQTQVGLRSLADLYRQQAETSQDTLAVINARNRSQHDLLSLLRRLRVDLTHHYDTTAVVLSTPPVSNPYTDESQMMATALHQRTDLAAAQAEAKAATWDVTTARAGYFPRLDAIAGASDVGRLLDRQIVDGVNAVPPSQPSLGHQLGSYVAYDAGLNLTWGLFDRYLTRLNVSRAQTQANDTEIDAEDQTLQVEADVQEAVNDYQAALQQLQTAAAGLTSAQESYDAVQARYDVGASSIVDLLTAQSALVQAQADDAQGRINFTLEERIIANILGDEKVQ